MANTPRPLPGQEVGRKLAISDFGWDRPTILKAVMADEAADVFLARVIGRAVDLKAYKSRTTGMDGQAIEGFGIRGSFEMTGPNGEVKSGALVYLPGYVTEMIASPIQAGDGDVVVDIAFDLYARYDESSATSYVYVARSLIKEDTSALDAIKAQLGGSPLPSLPAPKEGSKSTAS